MSPILCTLAALVLPLALGAATATRGALRTRRAARRTDLHDDPATRLPADLARIHFELLRARTELRSALGMPIHRGLDLRGGGVRAGIDAGPGAPTGLVGPAAVAAARDHLGALWRNDARVLGSQCDPVWHVHGRIEWLRVGPLGRQVLTVRATAGHDPGRWVAVRAERRTRRALPALGGGGARLRGEVRGVDHGGLLEALALSFAGPGPRPSLPARHRRSAHHHDRRRPGGARRRLRRLRSLAGPGWELVTMEVVGSGGPLPPGAALAVGRRTRPTGTSRPCGASALNPARKRPDHLGRKR